MKTFISFILLSISSILAAQVVPLNPDVTYGKLNNGLTYYIQKNTFPKERAIFYLVVNAGAINENENQNGLAHFCEHMAFNGTKAFPDKGILNYLESIGVSFGNGLNAYTSSDLTCYTLNNIPTMREGCIDSSLLILREWASNVSYTDEEINKERGVIHEEWRSGGGAELRMSKISDPVLYEGSKYANHNTIGEMDIIDKCSPEFLREYYKKWYRPDLQAVIIVGDIDKEKIKNKIEKLFTDIPKPQSGIENVTTLIKPNKDLKVTITTDKEAQSTSISLYIKQNGDAVKDLKYFKNRLIYRLYSSMLSDRFSELLQKENPPMITGGSSFGSLTKFQNVYTVFVRALPADPVRSYKVALTEVERVKKYGFTQPELDRAKKNMLSSYERSYNERDKQYSTSLASAYISHFTRNEPAPGITYTWELAKSFLPSVTLQQVNALPAEWITDDNRVIVITAPEKTGVKVPTENEIRSASDEVMKSAIGPYTEKVLPSSLISSELKGSPIKKREYIKDIDGVKYTLGNGARVWIKYSNNKSDEIVMWAFSDGGTSLLKPEDIPSGYMAEMAKNYCGLGEFSSQDLRKITSGKNVSISASLMELEEMLQGGSTVKDFETLLQLIYLELMPVRHDNEALNAMVQRLKTNMVNRKSNPNSVFSDTLSMMLSNYNPRTLIVNDEAFSRMNMNRAYEIANDRYRDASDFNFVFIGNVDTVVMKPLFEKYIGSIPSDNRKEFWVNNKIEQVKNGVVKTIYCEMKDPKSMVYVSFNSEYPCTPENVEYVNAIRYILNMRYTDIIREKEGGTYGVSVQAALTSRPVNTFKLTMNFTCAPEREEYLRGLLMDELTKLKKDGVTADEVKKTREYFILNDAERLKSNSYLMDRVKNYICNGVYTPLPQYSTDIYRDFDGKKIQALANNILKDNYFVLVMLPAKK